MEILKQYIVNTQYGLQLMVNTADNKWYLLTHHTLCYDGGGVATWEETSEDNAKSLLQ